MEQTTANPAADAGSSRRFKRARISLACTSCREHKTRCDGRKPMCSHCQRRNPRSQVPCLYRNQAEIRGSQEMQNLLKRIDQLEGELAAQKSSNSEGDLDRSRKHALPTPDHVQARPRGPAPVDSSTISALYPSLADATAGEQTSENDARSFGTSQPIDPDQHGGAYTHDGSSNEIVSRSPATLGPGGLNGCNVPGTHPASLADMHQNQMIDPSMDASLLAGSENQLLRRASQQTHRVNPANGNEPTTLMRGREEIDEPYFYGEESTTALMEEVNEMISPSALGTSGLSRDTPSVSSPPIYRKHEATLMAFCGNGHDNRSNIKDFDLPPRYLADHLINSYFDRVHILYPFIHRPTFMTAYEKLWAPATSDDAYERSAGQVDTGLGSLGYSSSESRVFYCGINAMFAMSCQFSDMTLQSVSQAAKGYLERGMALLLHPDIVDNGCVSLVQVLLLLSLHLQSTPLRNRLWNIVGFAVRMAQGLGLQDEANSGPEIEESHDDVQTEIRRRVWHTCTMLDMTVGMTLGRSPIISEGSTVPLPRPLNDESLPQSATPSSNGLLPLQPEISLVTFFVEAIKVSELTAKMLKLIYSRSLSAGQLSAGQLSAESYKGRHPAPIKDFSTFIHLETEWNALFDNLPIQLRFGDDGTKADGATKTRAQSVVPFGYLERQRNVLQSRLLHIKVLIHRPAFLQFCYEANPRNRAPSSRPSPIGLPSVSETINSSVLNHCAVSCFQTAKDLIHLAHVTHSTRSASAWWYNIYYTYTSGVIIILSRHCLPLAKAVGMATIDETWLLCQEILKNMAIYGVHAKRCLLSLEDLDCRLATWETESSYPDAARNALTMGNERPNTPPHSASEEETSGRRGRGGNLNQARSGEKNLEGVYKDLNGQETMNDPNEIGMGPDMQGTLPWNVNFSDWLTWNLDGTDFQDMSWQGPTDF